jgi:hypothetical protein
LTDESDIVYKMAVLSDRGGKVLAVKVLFVDKKWEADVCACIVKDRREAQMVVFPVQERWDAQTSIYLVPKEQDAELKVYIASSPAEA